MNKVFKEVLGQINGLKVTRDNIKELNKFFMALNVFLKGDNKTLITVRATPRDFLVISNILNDKKELLEVDIFKLLLIEFLKGFSDDNDLLYDIFLLLLQFNIVDLNDSLRLVLFKELYLSGYFCYVALDSQDFKDNYSFISQDLQIIANIVSQDNIEAIESLLTVTLSDLYLFDDQDLKDLLV